MEFEHVDEIIRRQEMCVDQVFEETETERNWPSRKGGLAMLAPIFFIARVEFDVTITRSFVLEESQAEIAAKGHLVTMSLFDQLREENQLFSFSFFGSRRDEFERSKRFRVDIDEWIDTED